MIEQKAPSRGAFLIGSLAFRIIVKNVKKQRSIEEKRL